jgi:hypothetical protein
MEVWQSRLGIPSLGRLRSSRHHNAARAHKHVTVPRLVVGTANPRAILDTGDVVLIVAEILLAALWLWFLGGGS